MLPFWFSNIQTAPGCLSKKEVLEICSRAGLHPRRDFLGPQFEQEIGDHALHPGNLAAHWSWNRAI